MTSQQITAKLATHNPRTMSTHIKITYAPRWKGPFKMDSGLEITDAKGEVVELFHVRKRAQANADLCAVAPEMADYLWSHIIKNTMQLGSEHFRQGCMVITQDQFFDMKWWKSYQLLTLAKALTIEPCDEQGGVS